MAGGDINLWCKFKFYACWDVNNKHVQYSLQEHLSSIQMSQLYWGQAGCFIIINMTLVIFEIIYCLHLDLNPWPPGHQSRIEPDAPLSYTNTPTISYWADISVICFFKFWSYGTKYLAIWFFIWSSVLGLMSLSRYFW